MAFQEKGNDTVSNGTTPVDVVPTPASAETHVVRNVVVFNADTVLHNVTVQVLSGANTRRVTRQVLNAGDTLNCEVVVNCDAVTKKVQVVLGEAHASVACEITAAYGRSY